MHRLDSDCVQFQVFFLQVFRSGDVCNQVKLFPLTDLMWFLQCVWEHSHVVIVTGRMLLSFRSSMVSLWSGIELCKLVPTRLCWLHCLDGQKQQAFRMSCVLWIILEHVFYKGCCTFSNKHNEDTQRVCDNTEGRSYHHIPCMQIKHFQECAFL